MTWIYSRRPQLRFRDKSVYADPDYVAFITFNVDKRRPIFRKCTLATRMVNVLLEQSDKHQVHLFVYCVMPDHVHLAMSPSSTCDVIRYVGDVKSIGAKQVRLGTIWQPSFHDRMHHRTEPGLIHLQNYILMNPVRAGLVANADDYPYSGVPPPRRQPLSLG